VIEDAIVILNSLQFWIVNHVKKVANRVFCRLVKEALVFMVEHFYMEEVFDFILDIVNAKRGIHFLHMDL
jgi:hypothetical protein